jgi:signal transduction histidine kinase
MLDGVGRRFARRAEGVGRRIEVEPPDGLEIRADRMRLDQAIGNMVDNALRYGAGTVTLRASTGPREVALHVLDRGEGLPPDFLDRAFERFSRASSSNRDGGSGLGLAIVRTIAAAHGGRAEAANRDGGGADVSISLPRHGDGERRGI